MAFLIYLLVIISFVFIYVGVFGSTDLSAGYKLEYTPQEMNKIRMHTFLDKVIPSRKLMEKLRIYRNVKNMLDSAHSFMTPVEFFNLKILIILGLFILLFILTGEFNPKFAAVLFVCGFVIPDIWMLRKIKGRKESIVRVLPETVDLLGLCVEAGLDFTMSVKWLIEKTRHNPLIEELRIVLEEIKWGKSRAHALKDMSKRLNIPAVSSFTQTLVQAERMGTPITEAFTILSEDSRMRRFQRGERFALKAPMKILVPLIFCILPVIGIIVGGPILLQFMRGDLFGAAGMGQAIVGQEMAGQEIAGQYEGIMLGE